VAGFLREISGQITQRFTEETQRFTEKIQGSVLSWNHHQTICSR